MNPAQLALATASKSVHPTYKLGAVLVADGHIVSHKYNISSRTRFSSGVCAEARVLLRPPKVFRRGREIYVARILRFDGSMAMARPCNKCMQLIRARGVKRIYYTTADGWVREDVCQGS